MRLSTLQSSNSARMELSRSSHPNRVTDFFTDKTILVTGATGFVGKVLLEKLLRDCYPLKKIYIIVRSKKGDNPNQRLGKIFDSPLFDLVKKQHGANVVQKVEAIAGDIGAPDLGLSLEDRRRLIEETEIVYHSAATVRFDEPLKFTVMLNTRGTKLLLDLAKCCKNLMVFSYISTAFCQEMPDIIREEFYPPPANPHEIIDLCENLDENILEERATEMRRTSANNYSFTKALAEALVEEQSDKLPVIVQRLPVVVPIWKEPLPGWTDNINGMVGLFLAGGKGVIRTTYTTLDSFINCSSVDMVAKDLILNTYYYHNWNRSQTVFNLTTPKEMETNRKTTQQIFDLAFHIATTKVPFNTVLWYPHTIANKSRIWHYLLFVFTQLLPALILDPIIYLTGNKPFLLRVQKRIWKSYALFEYYTCKVWNFDDSREQIYSVLNPTETKTFGTNFSDFILEDYFTNSCLGMRRYILNEPDEDIPKALKRMQLLWYFDRFFRLAFLCALGFYIFSKV